MTPILGSLTSGIVELGSQIIDRLIPDKQQQAAAKLELLKMQTEGELRGLETRMGAILAEAQSSDPWTSRARPAFLYVMYALILFALPMGVLSAIDASVAQQIADGMGAWLGAIPSELYTLFGVGYLGYAGARTVDKWKQSKN